MNNRDLNNLIKLYGENATLKDLKNYGINKDSFKMHLLEIEFIKYFKITLKNVKNFSDINKDNLNYLIKCNISKYDTVEFKLYLNKILYSISTMTESNFKQKINIMLI